MRTAFKLQGIEHDIIEQVVVCALNTKTGTLKFAFKFALYTYVNFGPINTLVMITKKSHDKVRFLYRQAATNSFLILRDRGIHTNPLFCFHMTA